jgi:hypothetical protein
MTRAGHFQHTKKPMNALCVRIILFQTVMRKLKVYVKHFTSSQDSGSSASSHSSTEQEFTEHSKYDRLNTYCMPDIVLGIEDIPMNFSSITFWTL